MIVNDSINRFIRTAIIDTPGVQISATDFGADRTGNIDSWAAITNAMQSLIIRGGTVFLPCGTYIVSQPLVIPNGVSLLGEGSGVSSLTQPHPLFPNVTKIKAVAGGAFSVIFIGGTINASIGGVSIERIAVIGGGSSVVGARGIDQQWANYTTIRDVRIHSCYQALYTNNVYACNIWGVNVDGGGADRSSYGLYMGSHEQTAGTNAVNVIGSYFQNCIIDGIRGETFSGSKFANCEITLAGRFGWYFGDPTVAGVLCQFSHISNCLVDSCAQQGYVFSKGTASRLGSIALTGCWSGSNHVGINIQNGDMISISGGLIQNVENGLVFNGCNGCVASGVNIFQYDNLSLGGIGIILNNSTTRCSVVDCVVRRSPGGIGTSFSIDPSSSLNYNQVYINSPVSMAYLGTATDTTLYNGSMVISGGDPTGVITPVSIGQFLIRIDTGKSWVSNGLTNTSWVLLN